MKCIRVNKKKKKKAQQLKAYKLFNQSFFFFFLMNHSKIHKFIYFLFVFDIPTYNDLTAYEINNLI